MNTNKNLLLSGLLGLMIFVSAQGQSRVDEVARPEIDNPISVQYLAKHLKNKSPKLILTPDIEKRLRQKLKSDPLVQSFYRYLEKEARSILNEPLLERKLEGFRLLAVSRELIERMGVLCMIYRIDKDPAILARIDSELKAVCNFKDWNPQHYLDVAEMSFGVALATDWAGTFLPRETLRLAKTALIEKGILPSYNENGERMGWVNGSNNWNAVCHGGMVAASLAIADVNPELAARTISRALDKLPNSLKEYAPDGVYPEGPTYWAYGTSYSIVTANMLTTALGTDFGISKSPGLMESANFILHVTSPSGDFFNFADSGDKKGGNESVLLSWFAAQTGDGLYLDKSFFENPENAGRLAGPALIWLSQFEQKKVSNLPQNWRGRGANPVVVFRGDRNDPRQFYLAAKGGKPRLSHGNMDGGTFVFELNGVRWVIDPGNQSYYPLNRIGFNLSGQCQECPRWTLLTKKNQGHSTITVNDARFNVEGYAPLIDFQDDETPEVSFDLTDLYNGNVTSLKRRIVKENDRSILIEDDLEINDSTRSITWGLMTVADIELVKNGAILRNEGKELHLSILAPTNLNVSVISLDPPPMEIDKTIDHLKRLEIRIPAWIIENGGETLKVRLSCD